MRPRGLFVVRVNVSCFWISSLIISVKLRDLAAASCLCCQGFTDSVGLVGLSIGLSVTDSFLFCTVLVGRPQLENKTFQFDVFK
jgi:hypothetical protein